MSTVKFHHPEKGAQKGGNAHRPKGQREWGDGLELFFSD